MDKGIVLEQLKKLGARKRNFTQRVDLIVNLKDLDLKKPEQQVDFFTALPHGIGKKIRVCAFIAPDLKDEAEKVCDAIILQEDFQKYAKDKKLVKKLARQYDFFIAQASVMPQVAASFGRILGPRNKMPNPKAGCVVALKTAVKPLYDKLQGTIRVSARANPVVQCPVGNEAMKSDDLAENIVNVYDQIVHHLPSEENNVRSVYLKLTMGSPVKLK